MIGTVEEYANYVWLQEIIVPLFANNEILYWIMFCIILLYAPFRRVKPTVIPLHMCDIANYRHSFEEQEPLHTWRFYPRLHLVKKPCVGVSDSEETVSGWFQLNLS
ncbi:hypothetical protein VNO77_20895 [Canavalia gladiata]|uniref:Uncharacterized protein n=1 Tax=Canavalia gladiata TaxID=3824 RepID=A0AAN9LU48_CANGL